MSFGAPGFLLGLLLVPLALAAYIVARGRARRYAVRFTAAPALKLSAGQVAPWRRHVPAAAALAALAVLALALAKPQRTVAVPAERASLMLVTDHSRSMLATDVEPDRLTASKRAARIFLDQLPDRFRVGVVSFSDVPDAVQAPSREHGTAAAVIDGQVADGATATGDALQSALEALVIDRRNAKRRPAAIILLSDGKTTIGRDPVEVAREARRLRIPISTVSLGTSAATVPSPDFGPRLPAIPDPETLERIAKASGGRAFSAEDDEELSSIYKTLGSQLGTREEQREVTSAFTIGGLVLLLGAAVTAVRSGARLP
ncbi:MAG: VWA domain-containing protein [Thermoleophilaceae bacterium]